MDRDDRGRYFTVGSVTVEIVTPLFQQRLESNYKNQGFPTIQAFLDSRPVKHTLFHLRHRNIWCSKDQQNCVNGQSLPLTHCQWKLLYTQETNPTCKCRYCHDHFTANQVKLEDLDITLAGLILLNCCNLATAEKEAICNLRQFKNDYLSHNTTGGITDIEYNSLWLDLTTNILKLDNSKADDIIRIQNRPMDESLCNKYCIQLLDIHKKLDEINTITKENNDLLHVHTAILQELLWYMKNGKHCQCCKNLADKITCSYKLGQSIFHLHHQFDLRSVLSGEWRGEVTGGVMMDDGRLVLCRPLMFRLLICNTDGSQTDSIPLQYIPWCVTAVNNSTVAVTSDSDYIEMYDINNKHKLKSIQLPGRWSGAITTIDNKLVVSGYGKIYIIDHQIGAVVQTIIKEGLWRWSNLLCLPCIHPTGDRIFYNDGDTNNLYCYSNSDDKHSTTTLPSKPQRITSLQDGNLYVVCEDRSVLHVSSDGKHYKPVTTKGLKPVRDCSVISYNQKQRKLVTCTWSGTVMVFHQMD